MFDVGDEVICINDRGATFVLCKGAKYIIRAVYDEFVDVGVINIAMPGFFAWRFRKCGDTIRSLDSESIVPAAGSGIPTKEQVYG